MLALGGLLACGAVAFAQDQAAPQPSTTQPGGKKRGGLSIEQLTVQLKLTDEQKPKVEAILKDSQKKRQELRADTSLTQEERRAKSTAVMAESSKKLKEILTPEQFEKYQTLRPGGKKGDAKKEAAPTTQ